MGLLVEIVNDELFS